MRLNVCLSDMITNIVNHRYLSACYQLKLTSQGLGPGFRLLLRLYLHVLLEVLQCLN